VRRVSACNWAKYCEGVYFEEVVKMDVSGKTNVGIRKMNVNIRKMTTIAVLSALSIVLMLLIRFPILPAAPYLIYEPADVPILIGGFLFGPAAGIIITAIVCVIQAFALSTDGWVGLVMHVMATGSLVITSSVIYRRYHKLSGAIIALVAGTLAMTLVMIPVNLVIQPNFYGIPIETVKSLLVPAIIPFNLIKAGANSLLTLLVYKRISLFVKKFI